MRTINNASTKGWNFVTEGQYIIWRHSDFPIISVYRNFDDSGMERFLIIAGTKGYKFSGETAHMDTQRFAEDKFDQILDIYGK